LKEKIQLVDFPYLVRLNPNIPWKTRGNASIAIRIQSNREIEEILDIVWNKSIEYTEKISKSKEYNRKPGVAITKSHIDEWFYKKAVKDIIPLNLAQQYAKKHDILIRGDRGIIGGIAAISFKPREFTYELITYRPSDEWNKNKREIDPQSVIKYEEQFFPYVFANFDYIKNKVLIAPHGNDPVLYGIRGVNIESLLKGLEIINTKDKIEMAMLFKTNQATDAHILPNSHYFYQTTEITANVESVEIKEGGDVLIKLDENLVVIVYKETGELNAAAKFLQKGDLIKVVGAIKPSVLYGKIIEAERIEILELFSIEKRNPKCPKCGGPTESLGRNKGYRCKKCGYRFFGEKETLQKERQLSLGIYQTRYYRHLTKPFSLQPATSQELNQEETNELVLKLLNYSKNI